MTTRADPAHADPPPQPREARSPAWAWAAGALLLLALVFVVRHVSDEQRLAALARDAEPGWLALAALLQLGTYLCAAAVWQRALAGEPARPRLRQLVPLGLAKLFTDQAVPSAVMSGTLLVVRALVRRGIPRGRSVAAMLVGLAAFYLAYAVAAAAALLALWRLGELDRVLLIPATVLGLLSGAVPAAIFGFGRRLSDRLPPVFESGASVPSTEMVERLLRAAGLEATVSLSEPDPGTDSLFECSLRRSPAERLADATRVARFVLRGRLEVAAAADG